MNNLDFYQTNTSIEEKEKYESMLQAIGSLSRMFSDNDSPYLDSRVTENLFCRYLNATNIARGDVTADAKKGTIGIGIKTWVGSSTQKIAEFDSERVNYEQFSNLDEKIKYIANLRNDRIKMTMRTYGLTEMVYHCIVRSPGSIKICECPLVPIDIDSISHIKATRTSFSFEDKYNKYTFNYSKSTLYKKFSDLITVSELPINIIDEPFEILFNVLDENANDSIELEACRIFIGTDEVQDAFLNPDETLVGRAILPLYSTKKGLKYVPGKNNLNMRFGNGRRRNQYEVGIPIPADFFHLLPNFFPGKGHPFKLILPDDTELSVKQCQGDYGKSLMSNPNSALGHWLIDTVFQIDPNIKFSYDILRKYGIDSVELSKIYNSNANEIYYKINFALCGSYENFKNVLLGER